MARAQTRDPRAFAASRYTRWTEQRARIDAAYADIKRGLHRGVVMATHGISPSTYERLAARVRAS